jgi:hypothetical protein
LTIIFFYAVKKRTRNSVILVPGNAQNAGFYTILPSASGSHDYCPDFSITYSENFATYSRFY